MKKSSKPKLLRDFIAIAAHFRNSAGTMKDKKKDIKSMRRESRRYEREY